MSADTARPSWLLRPDADARCSVVAEVAMAHDGSLGTAHAFVDAVAEAGADAIKFQTHIAEAESTPGEPWRVRFSPQDATRFDYWKRTAFSAEQWEGLARHARERGLLFLSTPFSEEAFALLEAVGVAAWKVASGEVTNRPLLERMAATGRPVLLSTGMSTLEEIDRAVAWIRAFDCPLMVLQCTSAYPCPPERVGLDNVPRFRERYGAAGLSDHSGTPYPSLAAVTLGAQLVEVHVTFDRRMFGPDVPASLTIDELARLVEGIGWIEAMKAAPAGKEELSDDLRELRRIFMKSLVTARPLEAGTRLSREHLAVRKPGTGIPPYELERVVGRRLRRALPEGHILTPDDLED
ncbi:MAG TPA: N-acetylneuraminate synthase [Rhodospirillales bacterium]|nr:N-acetylneuraminate synthase [Rhodospirillales bacterium]